MRADTVVTTKLILYKLFLTLFQSLSKYKECGLSFGLSKYYILQDLVEMGVLNSNLQDI